MILKNHTLGTKFPFWRGIKYRLKDFKNHQKQVTIKNCPVGGGGFFLGGGAMHCILNKVLDGGINISHQSQVAYELIFCRNFKY